MWRSRIMWRLFGASSIVVAAALVLLGWVLIDGLERHHVKEIRRRLDMKTVVVQELVVRQKPQELQAEVGRLGKESGASITLINADGVVLADSMELPKNMENHKSRPEIQEAEHAGSGVSTRYSGTVQQPMMYLARKNMLGPVRYVRLALPLDAVAREAQWLRRGGREATTVTTVP